MKAWYINEHTINEKFLDEHITFFLLYLLADESYMSSPLSGIFDEYNKRDSLDQRKILDRLYETEEDPFDGLPKKEIIFTLDKIRKVKSQKHKSHEDLVMLNFSQQLTQRLKDYSTSDFDVRFEEAGVLNWKYLPKQGKMNMLPYFDLHYDGRKRYDYYAEQVRKCILSKTDFHVFNMKTLEGFHLLAFGKENTNKTENVPKKSVSNLISWISKQKKWWQRILIFLAISITIIPLLLYRLILRTIFRKKLKNKSVVQNTENSLYSIRLFHIPIGINLEGDNVKMISNHLHKKIKEITDSISEFKKEISQTGFDENTLKKLEQFYLKIEPELKILQQQIDNELYLQQLIHASEKSLYYDVFIVVATIEQITGFYEKNGIFLPFEADAFRKSLSMQMDIKKCDLVLFSRFEGLS